jgi:hypothetical protein
MKKKKRIKLIFTGKPEDFNNKASIKYWQKQSAATRLDAVWDLVVTSWKLKGKNLDELRFQRSIALLKRM